MANGRRKKAGNPIGVRIISQGDTFEFTPACIHQIAQVIPTESVKLAGVPLFYNARVPRKPEHQDASLFFYLLAYLQGDYTKQCLAEAQMPTEREVAKEMKNIASHWLHFGDSYMGEIVRSCHIKGTSTSVRDVAWWQLMHGCVDAASSSSIPVNIVIRILEFAKKADSMAREYEAKAQKRGRDTSTVTLSFLADLYILLESAGISTALGSESDLSGQTEEHVSRPRHWIDLSRLMLRFSLQQIEPGDQPHMERAAREPTRFLHMEPKTFHRQLQRARRLARSTMPRPPGKFQQ